jgi:hypothetical protein
MTVLTKPLRRQLENAIRQAREIAETAAQEAIARIGVADPDMPLHLTEDDKALRRRLRAHGRALGDTRDAAGAMTTARLQDAAAYEIWHRMLFGRFLVERGLLIHPDLGAAISVTELRELAHEEGAADEWALAEKYAAPGLPGVFKPDDPVLTLQVAPEFSKRLRGVLSGLPEDVFAADDSLGWTYQFWRASEKDAVNRGGSKIGAVELPAVTQLFTESYMVKFLLHNTLGAWWAGKVLAGDPALARDAEDESTLRDACTLPAVTWEFLRFVRENEGSGPWRPAAGTFSDWPVRAAEITYCDPCCGSGHFLVEAFSILAALRQQEGGLSAGDAAVAVLRDNLHGLELDGRCVQIAAFNVALAAWKLANAPIALPSPHIAWVGAPPPMGRTEIAALGNGDASLCRALEHLHEQFVQAPLLGSLLEVGARDLLDADLRERGEAALAKLREAEPERAEGAVAARGLLDASTLLSRQYVLLATNVPFLGRGKQDEDLADYIAQRMSEAKADLATAMLQRMLSLAAPAGTVASVTPQNWLFLSSYKEFRQSILRGSRLNLIAGLGSRAFETICGEIVNVCLCVLSKSIAPSSARFAALDCNAGLNAHAKQTEICSGEVELPNQRDQLENPDFRIALRAGVIGSLLNNYAVSYQGLATADYERFGRKFWEIAENSVSWSYQAGTVNQTTDFGGLHHVIHWQQGNGALARSPQARIQGLAALGKRGVCISQMGSIPVTRFEGSFFDNNSSAMVILDENNLAAVWVFCSSAEYGKLIREVDQSLKVTNSTLTKVPFDLAKWKKVAEDVYPEGLPEPYSDDPTQWLFHGHPAFAAEGTELHVAIARIAGYRWPAEIDASIRVSQIARERIHLAADLPVADADGLLQLDANGNNLSLADRMRALFSSAYGAPLSPAREQALIRSADALLDNKEARDVTFEGWLADRAFRQHCALFHQRPFLWHIWDGMKGGFSAFLYYHRLDRAALDKLTYTLLGDWIRTAKAEGDIARLERAERLQQTLAKVIEGEKPFDIFVRWKSLAQQPIGWEPDVDDGVRLNMRPLMTAEILREQPRGISWNKDRGADVASAPWFNLGLNYGGKQGDRINDHHTTLAEKRAARGML